MVHMGFRKLKKRRGRRPNGVVDFWRYVKRGDGCWLWDGPMHKRYGRFSIRGRPVRAHRFAWELEHGDPGAEHVLHKCDVKRCVRVSHLYLGGNTENVRDALERLGVSPLCAEEVVGIRRLYADGDWTMSRLGERYGVGGSTISGIVSGRRWKHVVMGDGLPLNLVRKRDGRWRKFEILRVVGGYGEAGIVDVASAIGRSYQGAATQLAELVKSGELLRVRIGVYALP